MKPIIPLCGTGEVKPGTLTLVLGIVMMLLAAGAQTSLAIQLSIGPAKTFSGSDTNFQGGVWDSASAMTINGVTVTLDGPLSNVFDMKNSASRYFNTDATGFLVNNGTFRISSDSTLAMRWDSVGTMVNNGIVEFTGAGRFYSPNAGNIFSNRAGGVVISSGGGTSQFSNQSGTGGQFINVGGTLVATNGGSLFLSWGGASRSTGGQAQTFGAGTIRIAGRWSDFSTEAVGKSVRLAAALTAASGGLVLGATGLGLEWDNTSIINGSSANPITQTGLLVLAGTGARHLSGSGAIFTNSGTIIHGSTGTGASGLGANSSVKLVNTGSIIITNTGQFHSTSKDHELINVGTILKQSGAESLFTSSGRFINQGGMVIASNATVLDISWEDSLAGSSASNGTFQSYDTSYIEIGNDWNHFTPAVLGNPVRLSDDALTVAPGGMVLGVSDPGILWPSGRLINVGGRSLLITGLISTVGSSAFTFSGSGSTITNAGTFVHGGSGTAAAGLTWNSSETFVNTGFLILTNKGTIHSTSKDTRFINIGTILKRSGAQSEFTSSGQFINQGGTVIASNATSLDISWDNSADPGSVVSNGTFQAYDTSYIEIGSDWNEFTPEVLGNPIRLSTDVLTAGSEGLLLGVTSPGIRWDAGRSIYNASTRPLTHTGLLFTVGNGTFTFAGNGTITNTGTIVNGGNAGGNGISFANGKTFVNQGLVTLTNNGEFHSGASTTRWINEGTFFKQSGAISSFMNCGQFINEGGTVIASNATILDISWDSPTGSGQPASVASNGLFLTHDTARIEIGQEWNEFTAPIQGNAVRFAADTLVAGLGGLLLGSSAPGLEWPSGRTLACSAGNPITQTGLLVTVGSGTLTLAAGGGVMTNSGTIIHGTAGNNGLSLANNSTLVNDGLIMITNNSMFHASGLVDLINRGTMLKQSGSKSSFLNSGTFLNYGGTVISSNASILDISWIDSSSGGGSVASNGTFRTHDTAVIEIGSYWKAFSPAVEGNAVRLSADTLQAATGGSVIGVAAPGIQWPGGRSIGIASTRPLTMTGLVFTTGSGDCTISGSGTMTNLNTLNHGSSGLFTIGSSATLVNKGTMSVTNSASISGGNTSTLLHNDGTLIVRNTATKNFQNSGLFRNTGTFSAEGPGSFGMVNTFKLHSSTYAGTTLSEGIWVASNATFTFHSTHSDVATIDAGASVILKGSGVITEVGNSLATVNGTFGMHNQKVFSTTASLAIPGIFEVSLADPETNDTTVVTGIDMTSGAPNFTGCSVDVVDVGLTNGGTFTIMTWTGGDSGTPTIGTTPDNGLAYTLLLNDLNLQLNVAPPPKGMVIFVE